MKYAGSQTIKSCKEHERVEIPIQRLLTQDGQLNIYPEISGKGYFDVDYRDGLLILKATRYIGLIPISEEISIHVEPRAPISNLMHMIERAGMHISGLSDFIREYQEQVGVLENAEEVYVAAFVSALKRISETGILKRYVTRRTDYELRGRLLLGETIGRFRSRGISHRAEFEVYDLTEDNPENQIIKYTAERLLRHFVTQSTSETRKIAEQLRSLLRPFVMINSAGINADLVSRIAPPLIRGLPRSHQFYEPLLWLAYLVSTNSGVIMEKIGQARFETVILDAADIFERYIRRIIQDATITRLGGCVVMDGNVKPVPLFTDTRIASTKPDYYFLHGKRPVALADAKYKPSITAADRYELLAFCEALSVNKAAFIVPIYKGQTITEHHGLTASGRVIKFVGINLAASDPEVEERDFIQRLGVALGLS